MKIESGFLNLLAMFAISVALVTSYQNCSRYKLSSSDFASKEPKPSPEPGPGDPPPGGIDKLSLSIPRNLLSAEQTYSSMLKVTGLEASTATNNEFKARFGALSGSTDLTSANAPQLMATTSLAGVVCNGLVAKEEKLVAKDRTYFTTIDFAKPIANIKDEDYGTILRIMARNFWGRNETNSELNSLLEFRKSYESDMDAPMKPLPASSRNLMLVTCATMLSTFEAISY